MKSPYFIGIILIITMFSGCQKKNEAAAPSGILYFHLHTNIDTAEVDEYGTIHQDANGRRMYLSLAQLYLSGINAREAAGTEFAVQGAVILKVKDTEQYLVGNVPAGNYNSVSFSVGLDPAENQKDPSTIMKPNPLAAQDTSMWFGDTSKGYIFVNVSGGVDTTAAQNAAIEAFQPFSFQLGTSAELEMVSMPDQAFTVVPNQGQEVHIIIDYSKLLTGLNMKTENSATPFVNSSLAGKVAANITSMFRYEY
jgi:hypothetical protein